MEMNHSNASLKHCLVGDMHTAQLEASYIGFTEAKEMTQCM